jgi:outer membrane protein W
MQVPILATLNLQYETSSRFVPYAGVGLGGIMSCNSNNTTHWGR